MRARRFSALVAALFLGVSATAFAASRHTGPVPDVMVVIDEFDDGVVNTAWWQPVGGALLSESNGKLVVERAPGTTGVYGVKFVNPFPPIDPITVANSYAKDRSHTGHVTLLKARPAATDYMNVMVYGADGKHMDSTVVNLNTGESVYYDRDAFGQLRARAGAISTTGAPFDSFQIDLNRTYSLIPPACKGDKCDYGFDCCPLLIVAKWRIGASANRGGGAYLDPTLGSIGYGGVEYSTDSAPSFTIDRYEFHCGPDDYTGPEWRFTPNYIRAVGGQSVKLNGGPGFLTWGTPTVTLNGVAAQGVTVVNDTTITFIAPPSPTHGIASVSVKSGTSATEAVLDEDLAYYVSAQPLRINRDPLPIGIATMPYAATLTSLNQGAGGLTYAVASGALPPGLTLFGGGDITGTCPTPGVYGFHVVVTDAIGQQDVRLVWLEIQSPSSVELDADNTLELRGPNPVRGGAMLAYRLLGAAAVRLDILDAAGRVVRTMIDERQGSGLHQVAWDGRDSDGRKVPTGGYFYKLSINGKTDVTKAIVLH